MKTDIEYAALLMGGAVFLGDDEHWYRYGKCQSACPRALPELSGTHDCVAPDRMQELTYDPRHDDGDSRRLEIACLNWMSTGGDYGPCKEVLLAWDVLKKLRNSNDPVTVEAYRAAVGGLAVAIGKVIDGGGV